MRLAAWNSCLHFQRALSPLRHPILTVRRSPPPGAERCTPTPRCGAAEYAPAGETRSATLVIHATIESNLHPAGPAPADGDRWVRQRRPSIPRCVAIRLAAERFNYYPEAPLRPAPANRNPPHPAAPSRRRRSRTSWGTSPLGTTPCMRPAPGATWTASDQTRRKTKATTCAEFATGSPSIPADWLPSGEFEVFVIAIAAHTFHTTTQ